MTKMRLLSLLLVLVCVSGPVMAAPAREATLLSKVRALTAAQRGRLSCGVAIIHVEGGERVLVDAERKVPLASVFKLPILVEIGRRLQQKTMTLDASLTIREDQKIIGSGRLRDRPAGSRVSVREAVELMETISDNTATDMLFEAIGLDSVDVLMRGLGLARSDIYLTNRAAWLVSLGMGRDFRGLSARAIATKWLALSPSARRSAAARILVENRATSLGAIQRAEDASLGRPYADDLRLAAAVDNVAAPADLAMLLERLQRGELLDAAWTRYCLGVLGRQRFNTRIPRYLPRGTRTFHKTGSILGVVNDAGIIEIAPGNHVVVVVCCHDVASGAQDAAEELIGRVARAAYDTFR